MMAALLTSRDWKEVENCTDGRMRLLSTLLSPTPVSNWAVANDKSKSSDGTYIVVFGLGFVCGLG